MAIYLKVGEITMNIKDFIRELNRNINAKIDSGFLKEEYFTTCKYNVGSEVHSRMHALIVKTCYDLNPDCNIELERRLSYNDEKKDDEDKPKKVSFRPDITIRVGNKLIGIIEYESTNSSDGRFYGLKGKSGTKKRTSDLKYLTGYISDDNKKDAIPAFWIIISTLPKDPVKRKDWESRDFYKSTNEFGDLIKSPFEYYYTDHINETNYIDATKKILHGKEGLPNVFLLNINKRSVDLEYPKP